MAEATPPTRRRWLRWTLGCLALTALACCGAPLAGLVALNRWGQSVLEADNRRFAERLFLDAFADGDLDAAFERADPALRQAHPRDEFRKFFTGAGAPGLEPLLVKSRFRTTFDRFGYYKIVVAAAEAGADVTIYAKDGGGGRLVLVGVSPGLEAGLPDDLRRHLDEAERAPRRPSGWDLFD